MTDTTPRRRRRWPLYFIGSVVVVIVALVIIGIASNGSGTPTHAAAAKTSVPRKTPKAAPMPSPGTVPPTPSPAVLAKAAAILNAADNKVEAEFTKGIYVVGTPAGVKWWTSVKLPDSAYTLDGAAYKKVQSLFGYYDPPALDDWFHGKLVNLPGDITTWYQTAAPDPTSAQTLAAQGKVVADLNGAAADAKLVASGQPSAPIPSL